MAEQTTGGHGETAGEYIQHHLTNLQVCRIEQHWVWINVDTMSWSIVLGLAF
jgi:F-type H+-transporting ATPase subunit a